VAAMFVNGYNILLLESLKESEQLEKAKHDSWVGCVKEIFKYLKLDYISILNDCFGYIIFVFI
jgi:hypothetical protein